MLPAHAECNLAKGSKSLTWCMRYSGFRFSLATDIVSAASDDQLDLDARAVAALHKALALKHVQRAKKDIQGSTPQTEERIVDQQDDVASQEIVEAQVWPALSSMALPSLIVQYYYSLSRRERDLRFPLRP